MVVKMQIIENEIVTVGYNFSMNSVTVIEKKTNNQSLFAGWDNLKDTFLSYWNYFNDETDYRTTVDYFKPSTQIFING